MDETQTPAEASQDTRVKFAEIEDKYHQLFTPELVAQLEQYTSKQELTRNTPLGYLEVDHTPASSTSAAYIYIRLYNSTDNPDGSRTMEREYFWFQNHVGSDTLTNFGYRQTADKLPAQPGGKVERLVEDSVGVVNPSDWNEKVSGPYQFDLARVESLGKRFDEVAEAIKDSLTAEPLNRPAGKPIELGHGFQSHHFGY